MKSAEDDATAYRLSPDKAGCRPIISLVAVKQTGKGFQHMPVRG
jgi:hypothetical protein